MEAPKPAGGNQPNPVHTSHTSSGGPSSLERLLRFAIRRFTSHISVEPEAIHTIQEAGRNKTVVYVMPSASLLDYLLMNGLALQSDLPVARVANDIPMHGFEPLRIRLRGLFRKPSFRAREECRFFVETLLQKQAALLFLNRSGIFSRTIRWNVLIWEELLRAERKGKCSLALIPINILWGRRPERIGRSFVDILFGDTTSPGYLRKMAIVLRNYRHISLKVGRPIHLDQFLSQTKPDKDELLAKKLRRVISSYLYRERKLMIGPPLRSRERIIRVLLKDPELNQLITGVARREKKSERIVWKRAEDLLREMISDYDQTLVALSHRVFRWLWSRLYNELNVDTAGLAKFKRIARDYPVVLVPSHKSHMDYLLLSALLYENDLMPPHIAAGINLKFWPMGTLFRKNGAFFIRRSISGDLLYARLLSLYVRWLIRTGYSQEFFIEGGRSRTGKLIFPKHGLLSMQVDAFLSSAVRDLYVIPIGITYEKILEEGAYRAELGGQQKERENVWSVLRSRKLLRRSYGSVYVRFADPISLKNYFDVQPEKKISTKERRGKTIQLATQVIHAIASESVVTTTALVACSLLAQRERGIVESVVRERLSILSDYLVKSNVHCSPEVREVGKNLPKVIEFCVASRWVHMTSQTDKDPLIIVREDKRITLDYYKNTILHFFLPVALTSVAYGQGDSEKSLHRTMAFLRDLFAHEFLLPIDEDGEKLLKNGTPWIEKDEGRKKRKLYSGLVTNYLEAYDLAARVAFLTPPSPTVSQETIQYALALGNRLFATGDLTRRESISAANIQSAFTFFYERGLLSNREELTSWHERLKQLKSS